MSPSAKYRGNKRHKGKSMRSQPTSKSPFGKAARAKVLSLKNIVSFVAAARKSGKRIVTTNGCFDLLHIGHVRYLEAAKREGDVLVVGVNSDRSVRINKGKERPITPQHERAEVLAALRSVDAVHIFDETTPVRWLARVAPHVHVKGADWKNKALPERSVVERHGGTIRFVPLVPGRSTTKLIHRISTEGTKSHY